MPQYRAVVGIDTPTKRIEAGEVTSDLPEKSVKWLLASGFIEEIDGKGAKVTPVVEKAKVDDTYKADAIDGDGDGLVQDGTPFQRPAGTKLTDEVVAEKAEDK